MEKIIQDLGDFINYVGECGNKKYLEISEGGRFDKIVYRGQANKSWKCIPKLFRKKEWFENEKNIIDEILRRCPNDFEGLDAFEKLVKMQHYGTPTRLLDFTGNSLIALKIIREKRYFMRICQSKLKNLIRNASSNMKEQGIKGVGKLKDAYL